MCSRYHGIKAAWSAPRSADPSAAVFDTARSLAARPRPLQSSTKKQLALGLAVYLASAWLGVRYLAARGSPELALPALLAQACLALGLVLRFRVDRRHWQRHLWPAAGLAALCVLGSTWYARQAPWAMTPDFLVEELPIPELFEHLDTRLQTKARLSGKVLWWDEYPFGRGLEDPVKVRIENATGTADVVLDRATAGVELEQGLRLELVGRIRKWEGGVIRFVVLEARPAG